MNVRIKPIFYACFIALILSSCMDINLEEKHIFIPKYKWSDTLIPEIQLEISDTIPTYKVFIIIQHLNTYIYQNLWLKVGIKDPADSVNYFAENIILGTNEKGWLGSGFSNIFERRYLWKNFHFKKAGIYTFSFQQFMRENPLTEIVSVGVRVEK